MPHNTSKSTPDTPVPVPAPLAWNVKAPKQLMMLIYALLSLSVIQSAGMAFFVYRSTLTSTAMLRIQHYVVEKSAVTPTRPGVYKVFVPKMKTGYKQLKDGSARVWFEFAPVDASAAASLAQTREVPLYLSVGREK